MDSGVLTCRAEKRSAFRRMIVQELPHTADNASLIRPTKHLADYSLVLANFIATSSVSMNSLTLRGLVI